MPSVESRVRSAARRLSRDVDALRFGPPVTHVYNPLDYAWRAHAAYIQRFASRKKRVLYLGMNPGPFGMVQTGVPFGEVTLVREFLGIEEPVRKPATEHPKRPIQGFACTRSEVSGARVWGAVQEAYGSAGRFFRSAYLIGYCPLAFLEASGRNRTPDKLPAHERAPLYAACDRHLRTLARALEPEWVIGIGSFATGRAQVALAQADVRIGSILHPSPASPAANRGWAEQATAQLRRLGLCRGG